MLNASKKGVEFKGYYVNFCTCCITAWSNNQGWPKYLNPTEIANMIDGGAKARYAFCPRCKGEKHAPQNTKHSTR